MRNEKAFIYNRGRIIGTESYLHKDIYGSELMGMRLLRKKSRKEMAWVTDCTVEDIRHIETNYDKHPFLHKGIVAAYMKYLNCNYNHVLQFREIVDGHRHDFKESRDVNSNLRRKVYEKCGSKCVECGYTEKLHVHHVKEYAKGGMSELDNLVLLCAPCHANAHKDNVSYYALKAMAEK